MDYGVNGKILRVDLSAGRLWGENLSGSFYRTYYGGKCLAVSILLKELKPGLDPLSPDNLLIFACGPLTGVPVSGQGRNGVAAKSPLTLGFGSSEVGGFWGAELKRAGFDAVVIKGRAEKPVYLWIRDGKAEIRDAGAMWGKTTGETLHLIQEDLGDPRIRAALIGPAGERLIRYANITNDLIHFAGRGGLGAVMGSKNLKAIAVRSSGHGPEMADPKAVKSLARWMAENDELWKGMRELGTPGSILGNAYLGNLPTKNFSEPTFPEASAISGEQLRDTVLVDRDTCFGCVVRCKRVVELRSAKQNVDRLYGGPEYENIGAFGSNCGVSDLEAILKANEICNSNALDAISAGVVISFAMECFENGLISRGDTDGVELRFGNGQGMLEMLQAIVERKGLGNLLGEGVARAAKSIPGSERFAMHVKGEELPMHEPRFKQGQAVGFAVSSNGPDHMANLHDEGYTDPQSPSLLQLQVFEDLKPTHVADLTEQKVRILYYRSNWQHFLDCAVLCHFMPYSPDQVASLVSAVLGFRSDPWELLRVGERAATLARIFNLREGFRAQDDTIPDRFFIPFTSGPLAGVAPSRDGFEAAKRGYYQLMGWTSDGGVPTESRLRELEVEWATEYLPRVKE
ncbi:MAG: aldehyde ferredoxin oxidoreductase family protein [Anaerolineales bacterium]